MSRPIAAGDRPFPITGDGICRDDRGDKHPYSNEWAAQAHVDRLTNAKNYKGRGPGLVLEVYICRCGWYHVGHTDPNHPAEIARRQRIMRWEQEAEIRKAARREARLAERARQTVKGSE